jgi:hypothetical protein
LQKRPTARFFLYARASPFTLSRDAACLEATDNTENTDKKDNTDAVVQSP